MRILEVVHLSLEELEALRLSDLEGLDQEEAALRMGISRRALWDDLQGAREKMVDALVNGKAIEIKGGSYVLEKQQGYYCPGCQKEWRSLGSNQPARCPDCGCESIQRCCTGPHRHKGEMSPP